MLIEIRENFLAQMKKQETAGINNVI